MQPILIPALRASMGTRVYYVSTLTLREVADRVAFAREVHASEELNDLIQRRLSEKRSKKIADYLLREEQRFFNALVVGVYAGDPTWQDFGTISAESPSDQLEIPPGAENTFGFLRLTGNEKLFALDGQHRLAGIKRAVGKTVALDSERVTVIFIAHNAGTEGLQSTRRLFTVLNKTAKAVLKGDIIALDEDDLMAICTRRLVNESEALGRGQVAMRLINSLPPGNQVSWTTIAMVYDLLTILYSQVYPAVTGTKPTPLDDLKSQRASDGELEDYYQFAVSYFQLLSEQFEEVAEVLFGERPADAVPIHRHADGGSVLYRPLGQKIFTQVVSVLCKKYTLEDAIELAGNLPTEIADEPYADVIWNSRKRTMDNSGPAASLAKDLLLYMLGQDTQRETAVLSVRYADYLGVSHDEAELPQPLF